MRFRVRNESEGDLTRPRQIKALSVEYAVVLIGRLVDNTLPNNAVQDKTELECSIIVSFASLKSKATSTPKFPAAERRH